MKPVAATIAALAATLALIAGIFLVGASHGLDLAELKTTVPRLLALAPGTNSILRFAAAWGAIAAGALGVLTAFLAFIAPEEDDGSRLPRRGFPKAAPVVFLMISLGLAWIALRNLEFATPIDAPIEPIGEAPIAALPPPVTPTVTPPTEPLAPTPQIAAAASDFQWDFMNPLVRGDGHAFVRGRNREPFADNSSAADLLCGKAWVAVTGSASEEGPPDRNRARARLRAERASMRAREWLSRHQECGATIVMGVDLGQHAPTGGGAEDGARTGYQRQLLVISRERLAAEPSLTPAAAAAELAAALADPAARAELFGARQYPQGPEILLF